MEAIAGSFGVFTIIVFIVMVIGGIIQNEQMRYAGAILAFIFGFIAFILYGCLWCLSKQKKNRTGLTLVTYSTSTHNVNINPNDNNNGNNIDMINEEDTSHNMHMNEHDDVVSIYERR